MSEKQLEEIAINADLIVDGYAFTLDVEGFVKVLNLNNPLSSARLRFSDSQVAETTMCDIETKLVADRFTENKEFFEVANA